VIKKGLEKVDHVLVAGWVGYTKVADDDDTTPVTAHVSNIDCRLKKPNDPIVPNNTLKTKADQERQLREEADNALRQRRAAVEDLEIAAAAAKAQADRLREEKELRQKEQEAQLLRDSALRYIEDNTLAGEDNDPGEGSSFGGRRGQQ
jgi:hypothetical protein